MVASRVKADRHSKNLQHLAEASKAVSEATGLVVGAAKSGAEKIDEQGFQKLICGAKWCEVSCCKNVMFATLL